ncbi:hypothetical protein T440DRAFT_321688 [Plenodomus tracheiphilus IPT5]|uniref:Uncharacterized protein n=1 Tax=Plenodomus tracheiphilus IPT5 TaxID=1408161 RepID=A0A6A7BDA2_9PLEO|nr:hypothetical protein T440DRAFT_321688 [Plenodomus tracheiphilus IPT5]
MKAGSSRIERAGVYTNVTSEVLYLVGSWGFGSSLGIMLKRHIAGNKTCAGFLIALGSKYLCVCCVTGGCTLVHHLP